MNDKLSTIHMWVQKYLRFLPHLLIVASLVTYLSLFIGERFDLIIRASVVLLPLIATSIYLIFNKKLKCNMDGFKLSIPSNFLTKIYAILALITFAWTILGNRDLVSLILVFSLYLITVIHIFSKSPKGYIIVFEIMLTTMFLVFPQLFVPGFFYGDTDLTSHTRYAELISSVGNLPLDLFNNYQFFCLYHICISMVSTLTSFACNHALYIISTIAVVVSIPFVYLIAQHFTNSKQLALLSAFIYSIMPMILSALLVPAPRVMATMAFFIVLYLMFVCSKRYRLPAIILTFIMITYMSGVHHAQIPLILGVLALICIGCLFYFGKITIGDKRILGIVFILPIAYQLYAYLIQLVVIVENRFLAQIESNLIITTFLDDNIVNVDIASILLNLSSAVLTILIFIGLYFILIKLNTNKKICVFIPLLLLLFVLFVPMVMDVFPSISSSMQLYRQRMIWVPFFAIAMAVGCSVLINTQKKPRQKTLSVIFVIILCMTLVFSSAILSNSKENQFWYEVDNFIVPSDKYYHEETISMYDVISEYVPFGSTIASDREYPMYFMRNTYAKKYGFYSNGLRESARPLFISDENTDKQYKYVIFPKRKFESVGLNLPAGTGDYVENIYEKASLDEMGRIFYKNIFSYAEIYNNKNDIIYYS